MKYNAQFALGACSQIFNRLNIVEHFAGWEFCSGGWSTLYTHEIIGTHGGALLPEQNPLCVSAQEGDRTQVPVKNSVKQWNRRGPKPIVLIKNKSSLIFFPVLSVNLLG